jgi:hypothetical protein
MRVLLTIGAVGLLATPALASELEIEIEIPRLDVAEYHRPYVAVWLERADRTVAANLAVWYDLDNAKNEGDKWLKDLRQWWRRAGRELKVPADGITGPTRPVGKHAFKPATAHKVLTDLPPGDYTLVVEAAREVGGREAVRMPLKWPASGLIKGEARGQTELGSVSFVVKP